MNYRRNLKRVSEHVFPELLNLLTVASFSGMDRSCVLKQNKKHQEGHHSNPPLSGHFCGIRQFLQAQLRKPLQATIKG